jgi:hypothetical protein
VQLLLGHKRIESTVRYLGIEVDDALAIRTGRRLNYRGKADWLCPFQIVAGVPEPDLYCRRVMKAKSRVGYASSVSRSALASFRSGVSKPSVNQP